jgi:hypothetical protein
MPTPKKILTGVTLTHFTLCGMRLVSVQENHASLKV